MRNGGAEATDSSDVAVRITGLSRSFDGRLEEAARVMGVRGLGSS
jgi:hypothetical protein